MACKRRCSPGPGGRRSRKLLPYAGGKFQLVPRLLALMPQHLCYVEVFGGGAALLAAKDPGLSRSEVLNDIDRRLTGLYRVAKYHPEALQVETALLLRSRRSYRDFGLQEGLTDVQRAARYLFLLLNTFANRLSFDSFGYSTEGRPGGGSSRMMGHVWRLFDRLEKVTIEDLDFEELFRRYDRPHTFFYCDPPYLLAKAPYTHNMTEADHERLAACLARLKGKWLLSLNDVPKVRAIYRGRKIEEAEVRYGISLNKAAKGQHGKELLIRNY